MDVGICLPYSEPGITRQTLIDWCRAIEDSPLTSVSCGERISGPHAMEMRNMLAGAALLTERIRIVPTLYILPMHNAVWAAKEIATLDILSKGRVDVVVGTGGRPNDYAAVGADFATRNERLPGQVAQMRETWAGKPPFEGSEIIGPAPYQPGGPRVIGGFAGPKAITKSASWANGLYGFSIPGHANEIKEKMDWFEQGWAAAGRTGKPHKIGGFWYSLADNAKAGLHHYVYEYLRIAGHDFAMSVADTMTQHDPGLILETMRAMKETGIDELFMVPASADVTEVTRLGELVARNDGGRAMLLKLMMSPLGLAWDRLMVRWTGKSPLCNVFAKMGGFPPRPALLLVVKGRKTGKPRASALPYFDAHGKRFVVGSRGGGPVDPQWVTNLRADPNATIYVDRKEKKVKARIAAGDERAKLWDELGKMLPTYVHYQTLTTREIPLVILE